MIKKIAVITVFTVSQIFSQNLDTTNTTDSNVGVNTNLDNKINGDANTNTNTNSNDIKNADVKTTDVKKLELLTANAKNTSNDDKPDDNPAVSSESGQADVFHTNDGINLENLIELDETQKAQDYAKESTKDISANISSIYFRYSNKFLAEGNLDLALKYCALAYQFDRGNSDINSLFARIFYEKGEYLKSYYTLYYALKNPKFTYFKTDVVIAFYVGLLDRFKMYSEIKNVILKNLKDFEIINNSDLLYFLMKSAKKTNDTEILERFMPYVESSGNKVEFYSFLLSREEYIKYLDKNLPVVSNAMLDRFYPRSYLNQNYLKSISLYMKYQKDYTGGYDDDLVNSYLNQGGNDALIVYSMLRYEIEQKKDNLDTVDYNSYVQKFVDFRGFENKKVFSDFYSILNDEGKKKIMTIFSTGNYNSYLDTDEDGYNNEIFHYIGGVLREWFIDKNQDNMYDLVIYFREDGKVDYFDQVSANYSFGSDQPIDINYDTRRFHYSKFPYIDTIEFKRTNSEDAKVYLSGASLTAEIIDVKPETDIFTQYSLSENSSAFLNLSVGFVANKLSSTRDRNTEIFDSLTIFKNQFNSSGFPYKQWIYSFGRKFAYRQDTNDNKTYDYIIMFDEKGGKSYGVKDIDEDGNYDIVEEFKDDRVINTKFLDKNIPMNLYNAYNIIMADNRKFNDIFVRIVQDVENLDD